MGADIKFMEGDIPEHMRLAVLPVLGQLYSTNKDHFYMAEGLRKHMEQNYGGKWNCFVCDKVIFRRFSFDSKQYILFKYFEKMILLYEEKDISQLTYPSVCILI